MYFVYNTAERKLFSKNYSEQSISGGTEPKLQK